MLVDHLQNNDTTNRSTLLICPVAMTIGLLQMTQWTSTSALRHLWHVPDRSMIVLGVLYLSITACLVLHLPIDQLEYLLLMTVIQDRLLATPVVLHLLRIAICALLRPLSPCKMFHLVWVLQTGMQYEDLYPPWMITLVDLLKTGSAVLHLRCKSALLILRLPG
jgi:hypothetical protein